MRQIFLTFVFVVGCSTEKGPIYGLDGGSAVSIQGADGAAGGTAWGGTGGAAGDGTAGTAGDGIAGTAGFGTVVGGTGGKEPRPVPGDAETPPADAQEPVLDAGEDAEVLPGPDAGADAGEVLGGQCDPCGYFVFGPGGGMVETLQCADGFLCVRDGVQAEDFFCVKVPVGSAQDCGLPGLQPFASLWCVPEGGPTAEGCEAWLQQYGP